MAADQPPRTEQRSGRLPTRNEGLARLSLQVADRHLLMLLAIGATGRATLAAILMVGLVAMRPHRPKASSARLVLKHRPFPSSKITKL